MRVEFDEDPSEVREWIFTFGGGHVHPRTGEPLRMRFVRVAGTFFEARRKMASVFGMKWSHHYRSEEEAGVNMFKLTELAVDWEAELAALTVHLLREGRPLCGKPGAPGEWEGGHRWVLADSDDLGPRNAANCPGCLMALANPLPPSLVTSVRVETTGGERTELAVFVRGELAGKLAVPAEDARPLQLLLALLGSGKRCLPIDNIPWLVKDFGVLFQAADDAFQQASLDGYLTGHLLALARQLERLRPAFEGCEAARRMARAMAEEDR
jgi:hypothetical protein